MLNRFRNPERLPRPRSGAGRGNAGESRPSERAALASVYSWKANVSMMGMACSRNALESFMPAASTTTTTV